jgi:Tol biopolymer transport system component
MAVPPFSRTLVGGVEDWTHDGRFVIFARGTKSIWALPMGGGRKPVPVVESSSMLDEAHVSRDGRWLAYSGYDSGQWEVYVQPFLRPGSRVRVSTNGGSQSRWPWGSQGTILPWTGRRDDVCGYNRSHVPRRLRGSCSNVASSSMPWTINMTSQQTASGFSSLRQKASRPPG